MASIAQAITEIVSPKPTALIPVSIGCEEIEVAALYGILARGGVRVTVANVGGELHHVVKLAQGTGVQADKPIEFCANDSSKREQGSCPMASDPVGKLALGALYSNDKVVIAENCVTSEGPATAIAMALALVELLRGEKVAMNIAKDIAFKPIKKC
ncbi:unnamed protein product [Peronospora belbahrii]|uniref:DJ-1/PfpI domain-containing protein n=1 Tax=Peronospora belbahrii TaxID=622444 RepID=A0AAU9KY83_9STRA|nr:unnamed protein product [Peronospora belbahrii]CAH0478120.1 unnamed protein product [Peronospora belbahrii]CAH0513899.1 unnamed protein product [Peronospora belbahrii]